MKKNKGDGNRVVYSTDPESMKSLFEFYNETPEESTPQSKQVLRVTLDRKQRGGKEVTLITGFKGSDTELKELGSYLKTKCGVGGAAKDGEILVQGDHREKVIKLLIEKGYTNTKRTGG